MNHDCLIFNPETRERRSGVVTTEHSRSSYGLPVVIVGGEPVDAGQDGFSVLAVRYPAVFDATTNTYGHHPDQLAVLRALGKSWALGTYPDEA
jgi:hypothetical protein